MIKQAQGLLTQMLLQNLIPLIYVYVWRDAEYLGDLDFKAITQVTFTFSLG